MSLLPEKKGHASVTTRHGRLVEYGDRASKVHLQTTIAGDTAILRRRQARGGRLRFSLPWVPAGSGAPCGHQEGLQDVQAGEEGVHL